MTRLARIRDVFLPEREPESALFCTYGFDARFFESEILPAMFPVSLGLDRESGSTEAYLHAADVLLARSPVNIFYDHLSEDGPELNYCSRRVDTGSLSFHPKLIALDYGEVIRVVIGSANLTRPAWTGLLEIFRVEDLTPGKAHPWSAGLARFVAELDSRVPAEQGEEPLVQSLASVPEGSGDSQLVSTWDGPLLDALLEGVTDVERVDAVSPFFEGAEGEGVFDRLESRVGRVKGRLYTSTNDDDARPRVSGPPEKLRKLVDGGGWTLNSVDKVWDGDEEDAPLRALHGKLIGVVHPGGVRLMTGSANLTRAALLGRAPKAANVELVVIDDCTPTELNQALPQATRLAAKDVDFEERGDPTNEDDDGDSGAERFIEAATYTVASRALLLTLTPDAAPLSVRYDDRELRCERSGKTLMAVLDLAIPRYVTVDDGDAPGIVPFVIADPQSLAPRGRVLAVGFEEFCEILAGHREPLASADGSPRSGAGVGEAEETPLGAQGAIPWRRYLAAVSGIGRELELERHMPRGLKFTIENPSKLAGLIERLDETHSADNRRFTKADLMYALYELERELRRVLDLDAPAQAQQLLLGAVKRVLKRREDLGADVNRRVSEQLRVLTTMDMR